jgi:two-component system, OmpR family, aerobic respiration control sensor histidine kinase ArcB
MTERPANNPQPGPGSADQAGLSLLGHDLRAAVSDVIGGLRLIDDGRLDRATKLQLGRVRAASEVLARLLEDGLAAMLGQGIGPEVQTTGIQLMPFLQDVELRWSGRADEKGLLFRLSTGADLPAIIHGDRTGLDRIVSNLLSNAIKYTDQGTVSCDVDRTEDGGVRFCIRDNGPGFSEAALARLFQLYGRPDTAHKPGTGVGLYIAKEMSDRICARLIIHNPAGGGAEACLILPGDLCVDTQAEHDREPENPLPDLSGTRVLLAEDTESIQRLLAGMLAQLGAEVEIASDGVEALNLLTRESFDLALIDIEMPRLTGIEVMRTLRAMPGAAAQTPIIAVTAYTLRSNREAILAAGANGILTKPVGGLAEIGQTIAQVLAQHPPRSMPDQPLNGADFDTTNLDRLLKMAGPTAAAELLQRLEDDLQTVERGLVQAVPARDWPEIRAQTHVLIALAGVVGAVPLQRLAEQLNAAAHTTDMATLGSLAPTALRHLDGLIHFVGNLAANSGAAP